MKANVGYRHDESRFTLPKTKMTALEYDNSFILDYNKNKKIFITGIKQDINLPKISKNLPDIQVASPTKALESDDYLLKKVTFSDIRNYTTRDYRNDLIHLRKNSKINWLRPNSNFTREQSNLTRSKKKVRQIKKEPNTKLPKLEQESSNIKLKPVSFKLPLAESRLDKDASPATPKFENKFFTPEFSRSTYFSFENLETEPPSRRPDSPNITNCRSEINLNNLRLDFPSDIEESNYKNSSLQSIMAYDKIKSFKKNHEDLTRGTLTPPTNINMKKQLIEDTTTGSLNPLVEAKLNDSYGKPKTSNVIFKAKDPMNYSIDKTINDLKSGSQGRWSPIKIKPSKNIFDRPGRTSRV